MYMIVQLIRHIKTIGMLMLCMFKIKTNGSSSSLSTKKKERMDRIAVLL